LHFFNYCHRFRPATSQLKIAQFRSIKIQLKIIDITTRLRGIIEGFVWAYSSKHRNDAYCLRLNFDILRDGIQQIDNSIQLTDSDTLRA